MTTKHQKGFTLVELIIYMAVTTIAMVVLTSFIVDVAQYSATSHTKKEVQDNARIALERVAHDVHNADTITVDSVSHELRITKAGVTASYILNAGTNSVDYDNDIADGISAAPVSSNQVRVTIFDISHKTANLDEVSILLRVEQKAVSPKPARAYHIELATTMVIRSSIYKP